MVSPAFPRAAESERDVTAIVPTFNRAAFLRESLQSLLEQSAPPRQIVVVDDGSSDDTAAVAASFAGKVDYLRKDNGGKASALNLGIAHADGDSIWIFDDDDLADPDALRRLSDALEREPAAGFAFADYDNFRVEAGGSRRDFPAPRARFHPDDLFCALLERCFIFQPALLVRRRCYDETGPFDVGLTRAQDYDMLLRLALRFHGTYVPHIAFHQRAHEGRRGSADEPIDGSIVWERQKSFNARVFRKIYDGSALADYLPQPERSIGLDPHRRFRALLRRSAAMARGMLWDEAAADLQSASDVANRHGFDGIPAAERAMFSRIFDEFGPHSEFDTGNPLLMLAAGLPRSPFRTSLVRALTWPAFRYLIGSLRSADFTRAGRNLRLYRRFADLGTMPAHVIQACRNQIGRATLAKQACHDA